MPVIKLNFKKRSKTLLRKRRCVTCRRWFHTFEIEFDYCEECVKSGNCTQHQ